MKLRRTKLKHTKSVLVFWAILYKVNVLTRNIKRDPLPPMKILRTALYTTKV